MSKDWISTSALYGLHLSHHGILGQKWGRKNGPPYPLDYESHSKRQKQENRFNKNGEYVEGKKRITKSSIENKTNRTNTQKINKNVNPNSNDNKKQSNSPISFNEDKSHDDINRELLKKNPNAAVVNPDLVHNENFFQRHKKGLIIGGAAIAAVAAVGVGVYLSKKNVALRNIGKKDVQKTLLQNDSINSIKNFGYKPNEASKRFIDAWLVCDKHRYDAISIKEFESLGDDSFTLPVGQSMFRMAKGEHGSLRDGIEYVSFGSDRMRYKGFLPQMWNANSIGNIQSFYEYSLHANTEVKVPSKKFCIQTLMEIYKERGADPNKALKYFYVEMANLIDRDSSFAKTFFAKIQKAGYNAIIDYNDAGRLANKPLILFNAAKNATLDKVEQVTKFEAFDIFQKIEMPDALSDFSVETAKRELGDNFMYQILRDTYTSRF